MSAIDPASEQGERPDMLTGNIEFTDVVFSYPSRPDVQVVADRLYVALTVSIKGVLLGLGTSWVGHQCESWADSDYSGDYWVW